MKIKITLEATGHNQHILTEEHIKDQGVLAIVNLIIGWMCMFYPHLMQYTVQKAGLAHLESVASDVNQWLIQSNLGGTAHQRSLEEALNRLKDENSN